MINIFDDAKDSRSPKRKGAGTKVSKKKQRLIDRDNRGKEQLDKLNPMVIPMLGAKIKESPNNDFLKSSISVIMERPYHLSDKWIDSLNKWIDSISKAVMLDEPELVAGDRIDFGPFAVVKIAEPSSNSEYPMPAIICTDDRGWKWYFKTSKAYSFKQNDSITFTATVSSHKEGITFLRRPSKIKKVISILNGDDGEI